MEKIIHQIWVGPYEIPKKEKYFVERNKKINKTFEHILWTDNNLPSLPEKIQEHCDFFRKRNDYAFLADVLRIFIIKEYGGFYLDIDTRPNKSIDEFDFDNYNGILPYFTEYTVGNTFFGCAKNGYYINHHYNSILNAPIGEHFFPYWFNKNLREYYGVEDVHESEYHTEKCKIRGEEIMRKWKNDKMLCMNVNGEFAKYFSHIALNSWGGEQKQLFIDGNINYDNTKYSVENYKID